MADLWAVSLLGFMAAHSRVIHSAITTRERVMSHSWLIHITRSMSYKSNQMMTHLHSSYFIRFREIVTTWTLVHQPMMIAKMANPMFPHLDLNRWSMEWGAVFQSCYPRYRSWSTSTHATCLWSQRQQLLIHTRIWNRTHITLSHIGVPCILSLPLPWVLGPTDAW